MSDCTILTGDCREILETLPRKSVDMVLADPPYGVTSIGWDHAVEGWLDAVAPVLKPSGTIWMFGSLRSLLAVDLGGWKLAQEVIWEKHNGSNFHADRFRRVHEIVVQLYRGAWSDVWACPQFTADATAHSMRRKARPPHMGVIGEHHYESVDGGPRLMRSVMRIASCHGYANHPTQKPTTLLRHLIEYSCPPGGVVLDPMAGSGSTGVAAMETGRRAILIELNPEYVEIAHRRIGAVTLPLPLHGEETA